MKLLNGAIVLLCVLVAGSAALADTVSLEPVQDNSLYENFGGNESNGAGVSIFSGQTNCCGSRRALLAFDVAGNVPAGATIDGASLQLVVTKVPPGGMSFVHSLHRVLAAWGEGTSTAGGAGGFGGTPTTGDATWSHTFFDTDFWASPGGDFAGAPSGSTSVGAEGPYTWSSAGMAADVQAWLDSPAANFGWILLGQESSPPTAKRFGSRENGDVTLRPVLTIEFTEGTTCGDGVVDPPDEECDDGNTDNFDACRNDCTLPFCGDGIVDAGEECDDGNTSDLDPCLSDCTLNPAPIPTASEWGLIAMVVLLLTMGTLVFRRRAVSPRS